MAEHVDVLIVGAGLSGIGAAHHLQDKRPGTTYAILEARGSLGGTWDLFTYPGVRSDSDMFTLGYRLSPWKAGKVIADGGAILSYVRETARENGIDEHIRYHHRVRRASWSSDEALWTVEAEVGEDTVVLTCSFLYCCGGYYRYDEGFTPAFDGTADFAGQIVHPQHWPDDLDVSGKKVVVIGSGATAVTLVPALAETAAHVTMLQRSPTYIVSLPDVDPLAGLTRRLLPEKTAFSINRWKNVLLTSATYELSRRRPSLVKKFIKGQVRRQLPADFDVDTHFTPRYDPWDQRLCVVPNGDLFKAIKAGRASVATDQIETFTPTGLKLTSGRGLDADVVVTATGLNLLAFGGLQLVVDGVDVDLPSTMAYKSMMLTGVPNFAFAIGYTNASWTLKVDLTSEYLCRLLAYMDESGYRACVPERDPAVPAEPFLDFQAGYVLRSVDQFPKQGATLPWRVTMSYLRDYRALRRGSVTEQMRFFDKAPASVSS